MALLLNAAEIDRLPAPTTKTQAVTSIGNRLSVIINRNNTRSIVLRYRPAGHANPVNVTVCQFDVGSDRLTLAQIERKADELRLANTLPDGRVRKLEAPADGIAAGATVSQACKRWAEVHFAKKDLAKASRGNIESTLRFFTALFGPTPIASLKTTAITRYLETVLTDRGPAAFNFARGTLSQLFAWARRTIDGVQVEPRDFPKPAERGEGETVLDEDQIRALFAAKLSPVMAAVARLQLLTGLRAVEAAELRWSEVQADAIFIPGSRMKMGKDHTLPITPAIRAILDQAKAWGHGETVFGRDAGTYKNRVGNGKRGLQLGFSSHDLRRTISTYLDELGVDLAVIDMITAHSVTGVRRHYIKRRQRTDAWLPKMADALNLWAAELDRILGVNVVSLRRAG